MSKKKTRVNKKRSFKHWLITISLFLLSIGLLSYWGYQHYQELLAKVEPLKVCQPKKTSSKISKSESDTDYAKDILKMVEWNPHANQGKTKIGYVGIPSRHILLPIYVNPYSSSTLNLGAASIKGEKMGQATNFTLAAHNFNNHVTGFSALQLTENKNAPYLTSSGTHSVQALKNTKVYTIDKKYLYVYKVKVQNTVYKTKVSVMDSNNTINGQPTLTIISCLFPNINYRIITRATLLVKYPVLKAPKDLLKVFDMRINQTNAHVNWWNPGQEEGSNGAMGGFKN
ncbi:class A sortase [Oenococcus oeni]|uniref:class A sortase n=1 Tax=Oenococcus oeni TaxID=1247 RepID=UPI00050F07C1|nr:class A sortase [Oenococcus oeni]KGH57438.1 sortase [Oenococcus oeni IOEB_B10]